MSPGSSGNLHEDFAVLILCGGKSSRMGTPKAFLEVGGVRLIERVIGVARELSSRIFLVTPQVEAYKEFGLPLVSNEQAGKGPLAGLCAGLETCGADAAWALACDLPDLSAGPLLAMKRFLGVETDAVIPRSGQDMEPLCALYRSRCAGALERSLSAGRLALHRALADLRVAHPSAEELGAPAGFFENLNTPEDLERRSR